MSGMPYRCAFVTQGVAWLSSSSSFNSPRVWPGRSVSPVFRPAMDNRLQSEKIFIVFGSMRFLAQLLSFELLLLGSGAPNFLLPTTL
jgi:hypothetical protein